MWRKLKFTAKFSVSKLHTGTSQTRFSPQRPSGRWEGWHAKVLFMPEMAANEEIIEFSKHWLWFVAQSKSDKPGKDQSQLPLTSHSTSPTPTQQPVKLVLSATQTNKKKKNLSFMESAFCLVLSVWSLLSQAPILFNNNKVALDSYITHWLFSGHKLHPEWPCLRWINSQWIRTRMRRSLWTYPV